MDPTEKRLVDAINDARRTSCDCGCGRTATKTIWLLREQDAGTADALQWAELSIAPMRVPVRMADGHDEGGIDGYVSREDEGA